LQNNTITYAGDPNWLPYEAFDIKGNYIGIIAEHIEIVEKKLNKKFDKVITKNWMDTLELSKKVSVDIISGDAADVVLGQNYKAIDTYIKNPLVIVTRKEHQYIDDINSMKDKRIAFIDGYGYSADIFKKYPNIKFIKCDTPQSGLTGVKIGQYDAFIGTLAMSDYTIMQMSIEDIKISGQLDIVMNVTLFVDKDKPLLYSILNKSIESISKTKQHDIISKWRSSSVAKAVNYKLLWQAFVLLIITTIVGALFLYILRRNNKKLHKLVNSTIDGMAIFKNGKLVKANQQFLDMYGYGELKEIVGKRAIDFVEGSQHSFLKKQLKTDKKPYEIMMLKKDNTLFPGLVRGTQLDANTRVSSVFDLGELKDTQNKLKELNRSLEDRVKEEVKKNEQHQLIMMQQNRLAQMGEIINMIAHQWRQPLNALSVISQTLVFKYMRGTVDEKAIDTFNTNSQRQIIAMSTTIDDFRNFFKPEKEKKIFDIRESINHSIKILLPLLENENIKLNISMCEDINIYGFSNELGQGIINIITNAKDALIEKNIEEKHINIDLAKNDTQVILTISDNAGGIPEDIILKIFNPYFSTKERDGTGLGLYMTKLIIEEHMNGKITVENIDKGAQFNIIFDRVVR